MTTIKVDRPTLGQLRGCVQKGRHREIGNVLARRVARPSAVYGTWLALRLGASAHQVTCAALFVGLAGALAIASGSRMGFIAGVVLQFAAFWLDHVDGQVARWRETSSLDGVYFDYLMHHASSMALGFALGYGLAARSGDCRWAAAGFALAAGWAGLSLHNDCRYKAFFQRLKRETSTSYRVDGGSGGRPSPAPPRPRRGVRALAWPLYKVCEPHVVLMGLGGLSLLAVGWPELWLIAWRVSLLAMALLAPGLATARVAKAVKNGSAEGEFARWFKVTGELSGGDVEK